MKKVLILLSACFIWCCAIGQANQNSPVLSEVFPPGPEAATLVQNALGSTSFFSGKAQASIPLYNLKLGDFDLPVALNYNSGGFKVDEVPTMEGLSWSLSCVGVVTRTIHGKPDDDPNIIRADVPAVNMNDPASVQALADFYADVTDATGHFDTEADEYSVAAPGLSMKFLFDNAGNLVQFPYSNNRVEIQRATAGSLPRYIVKFIITNTEGVVYEFGSAGAIEKVTDHNINLRGGVKTRLGMSTAFYLTKITLPDGKNIQFDYLGFFNWGYSGAAESITRGGVSPPPFATCLDGTNVVYGPGAYPDPNSHVTTLSYIRYNQISLSSIISSNGQHINFNYGATPPNPGTTITADCLQSVEISAGDFHRTYSMSYSTPAPTDIGYHVFSPAEKASHVRFFLKDVSYTMPNTTFAETVKYQIDYNENQNLPCILSFAQDYLGYFNGYDNGTLLPYQNNSAWQGYANGLRSYNGAEAKKGMLEKITFPTGGYEKFNYEPNTVATWDFVSSNVTLAVGGQGMSAAGTPHRRNYESAIFHVYRSQTAQLTLNISGSTIGTYGMLLGLTPGTTDYDGVHNYTIPVSLVPGDYKLTISVAAGAAGDITLVYDRSQNPDEQAHEWVNHEAGGVRVSSIESYDPVSDKTKSRYFTYAHKNSLSQSSGRTGFQTLFDEYSFYKKETTCPDILLPGNNYWVSFQCPIYTLSSNAMVPSAIYGDHIGYQNVIESDDPAFKNGGIQHTFDATSVGNIQHVRGSPIRDLPVGTQDFTRGIEMETEYFDKLLLPVKHVQYHHVEGDYCLKQYIGKAVRQKYDHYAIHGDASNLDPYDETDYIYRAFWDQLDYVTTTDFENGVQMSNRVEHSYNIDIQGNPVNIQPIQTSTTDSKGLALTTDMTYPTDYTDAVSQTMVAKNMISPVINVKQQRDGVEIKSTTTHYRDWNNNGNMIKPETVSQSLNGNTEEDRIRYYGYNVKGNPVRMSKENDLSLSYIWGYDHNFPVAEANTDKLVTYSSFEEATEEAPWSGINQTAIVTGPEVAMTGKNYYEENNFSLDCKPHTGIYVVSYWCDNDNGYSVSGTMSGWPKLIRSVTHGSKTWRLFEHRVNVSDIAISGSGAIDELRCYPADSKMKTFTYSPFVGISSQCDENNNISYFEYDGLQRLTLVRDIDRNILKKICYNYAGQPENCGVNHFYNTEQSRTLTRTNCPPNTTAGLYTYIVPANTYSSTIDADHANQMAIADLDQNAQAQTNIHATCEPIPCSAATCSGICINGVCDPGTHILISKEWHMQVDPDGYHHLVAECKWINCYSDGTWECWYPPYGAPEANCMAHDVSNSNACQGATCP